MPWLRGVNTGTTARTAPGVGCRNGWRGIVARQFLPVGPLAPPRAGLFICRSSGALAQSFARVNVCATMHRETLPEQNKMRPMTEKEYQARDDMRTLAAAEEIRADKARHGAAQTHAKKEAARLMAVTGSKTKPNPPSKAPASKATSPLKKARGR